MSSYSVSPRNTASDEPLVTPGPWHTRSKAVVYNFYFMCLCFSLNHGCVTAILALASASLGDKLGGFNSGTLYTMYTLSSLFIASLVVRKLGPKWSLVGGLALYVPYVASFLIAVIAPSVKW